MRLTLVIHSLDCGGAERVMSVLANRWAACGKAVTLLTLDDGRPPFYELDARVRRVALGLEGDSRGAAAGAANNLARARSLRRAVRDSRPDAVISFMCVTNVLALLATRGLRVPVVVAEHTDPHAAPGPKVWRLLRLATYALADLVVVLDAGARDYFARRIGADVCVIPNPVQVPPPGVVADGARAGGPRVAALGRLVGVKGFDLLLHAFVRVREELPRATLTIYGEGPSRAELEALRDSLGLADSVDLPGRVGDPHAALRGADLFVMPSRHEGFPMALCEAMACGLPVVCTDTSAGPREIVRDGVDGLLVPGEDTAALGGAMLRLLWDGPRRAALGARAAEITERFSVESVLGRWEAELENLLAGARRPRRVAPPRLRRPGLTRPGGRS